MELAEIVPKIKAIIKKQDIQQQGKCSAKSCIESGLQSINSFGEQHYLIASSELLQSNQQQVRSYCGNEIDGVSHP